MLRADVLVLCFRFIFINMYECVPVFVFATQCVGPY